VRPCSGVEVNGKGKEKEACYQSFNFGAVAGYTPDWKFEKRPAKGPGDDVRMQRGWLNAAIVEKMEG